MQRQHPAAILALGVETFKNLGFAIVLGGIAGIGSFDLFRGVLIIAGIIIAVALLSLLIGLWSWAFFRYQYESDALHTISGAFLKKRRHIKSERVQTVNREAGVILRALKLTSIRIETAGGLQEAELYVRALRKEEAAAIEETLKGDVVSEDSAPDTVYQADTQRLFIAGATSGGSGFVALIGLAVIGQLIAMIPDDMMERVASWVLAGGVLIILALTISYLFSSWLISLVRYLIRYAFFTVTRENDEIHISHGLIVKRKLSLKLHRVQAVKVVEGLIRQPFSLATVEVEAAGGSAYESSQKFVLFPLLKRDQIGAHLDRILPEFNVDAEITPVPRRALTRYMIRGCGWFVLLTPLFYFVPETLFLLVLLPVFIVFSVLRFRDAGHALHDDLLISQFRYFARTRAYTFKRHIQALEWHRNILQRFRKLASLQSTVLSAPEKAAFKVKDISEEDVWALYKWYSRS